jgi:hypothetical protein
MYNSLKKIIFVFVLLFIGETGFAQFKLPHVQLILNANYANPSNSSFSDLSKGGLGIEAGAGLGLGSTMFMGTAGYQRFGASVNNPAGSLNITTLKGGIRQYMLLGRLFVLGNIGTAIQSYASSGIKGDNLIYEYGGGVRLFGLEVQLTQSHWQQPINVAASRAFNIKVGFSFKL